MKIQLKDAHKTVAKRGGRANSRPMLSVRARVNSSVTVDRILTSARRVLITHGYAAFTTRRVAEAADMAPGNLAYHFPSKRELVRALIARLMADLTDHYHSFYANPQVAPGDEIASLVKWALDDTVSSESMQLFRELWTMTLRDLELRQAVDDFYDVLIERLVQMMHRLRPQVDIVRVREYMHIFALISEGCNVLYGTRRKRAVTYQRIIEITIGLTTTLAPEAPIRTSKLNPRPAA